MSTRDTSVNHEAHIVVAVPVRVAKRHDIDVNLDEIEVTFTTPQGAVWLKQSGKIKELKE